LNLKKDNSSKTINSTHSNNNVNINNVPLLKLTQLDNNDTINQIKANIELSNKINPATSNSTSPQVITA